MGASPYSSPPTGKACSSHPNTSTVIPSLTIQSFHTSRKREGKVPSLLSSPPISLSSPRKRRHPSPQRVLSSPRKRGSQNAPPLQDPRLRGDDSEIAGMTKMSSDNAGVVWDDSGKGRMGSTHDERVGHWLSRRVDPHRFGSRVIVNRIDTTFPAGTAVLETAEGGDR